MRGAPAGASAAAGPNLTSESKLVGFLPSKEPATSNAYGSTRRKAGTRTPTVPSKPEIPRIDRSSHSIGRIPHLIIDTSRAREEDSGAVRRVLDTQRKFESMQRHSSFSSSRV